MTYPEPSNPDEASVLVIILAAILIFSIVIGG